MPTRLFQILLCLGLALAGTAAAQTPENATPASVNDAVARFVAAYRVDGYVPANAMRADSLRVDDERRRVSVWFNEAFCAQPLTPQRVGDIQRELQRSMPAPYNTYRLDLFGRNSVALEEFIPNALRGADSDASRLWGNIDFRGRPWVSNASRPYTLQGTLAGRHLMINASHGRYYRGGLWRWQRPYTFCTTEDLFTQSIVFPFLIPMLERAGAVVGTSRERDYQRAEAVVDNDPNAYGIFGAQGEYAETVVADAEWSTLADSSGFAPVTLLRDSTMPFTLGTARQVPAVQRKNRLAQASWSPRLPKRGRYAVYVSYASRPNSISDARYTVYHSGGRTQFRVNQQIGGGTWVYLGTFLFDEGERRESRVVLTNQSDQRGIVTADAVRFGGGEGQTERGEAGTSGLPRFLEGARYYTQWAGLVDTLFCRTDGTNDYNDDIRTRSYYLNTLGGGSAFMPGIAGRGVPFELALAMHSDAGVRRDGSIFGSLAIGTTVGDGGETDFPSGMSRRASTDFAAMLLDGLTADLSSAFSTTWTRRELWDRNYGETRSPLVPSAILEILSHQNFRDMTFGHDPLFKQALARSVYKTIARFVAVEHGQSAPVIQPLAPRRFAASLSADASEARLSWAATVDSLEPSAVPTGYVVYTRLDDEDFDNGRYVTSTSLSVPLTEGRRYSFRVAAVNAGGESAPSETLTVRRGSAGARRVLIVNAFTRLSGPARIETADSLGFDLDADLGVPLVSTTAFAGRQRAFDVATMGGEGAGSLGFSGSELMGTEIAGNTFDFPAVHAEAIAAAGDFSVASTSREALLSGDISADSYAAVDWIFGLERNAPHNLRPFKTFDTETRHWLGAYLARGGRLFVSGSYLGADLETTEEMDFARDVLHFQHAGTARTDSTGIVVGLNLRIPFERQIGRSTYCVQCPDVLVPTTNSGAFPAFAYSAENRSAGIAFSSARERIIAMGFPFESITDADIRRQAIGAILDFLTANP